ncbi:hypothetical protein IWX63_003162 [Arthrobacter sp. CAN_A2]
MHACFVAKKRREGFSGNSESEMAAAMRLARNESGSWDEIARVLGLSLAEVCAPFSQPPQDQNQDQNRDRD